MRFKFAGNFKALEKWRDKIETLPSVLVTVNEQLAEEAIDLVHEGFETQTDPNGRPWAPHAALTRAIRPGGRILEDNGQLKSSWFKRHVGRDGFGIGNPQQTAEWAQEGTGLLGPKKRAIKPIHAKSLRIPTPGGPVFLGAVAGQPPRKMVPEGSRLPARWKKRFVETAQTVLLDVFRG